MSDFKKKIQWDLRAAFIQAVLMGSRHPINALQEDFRKQINSLTPYCQKALDLALASSDPDMRSAKDILASARKMLGSDNLNTLPATIGLKQNVTLLKQALKIAENLKVDSRAYTVKANAKYIGAMAAASAALFLTIPAVTDAANAFNNASTDKYMGALLVGLILGGIRGALINTRDYLAHYDDGIKHIELGLKTPRLKNE